MGGGGAGPLKLGGKNQCEHLKGLFCVADFVFWAMTNGSSII